MRRRLPSRGDVWLVNLDPARGHAQAGTRPCLVVSTDTFNHGPSGLVIMLPVTTRQRGIPLHVFITPGEGGLLRESSIKCEDIRSVSTSRFIRRLGACSSAVLAEVDDRLRTLLEL